MCDAILRRVLSIQSHVVSGYCGNKSAVFPMQLLGFEVDPINSVQFSNHTWYDMFKGQVLNDGDLSNLYEALSVNQLNDYSHVLTGYIGSESFLLKVCDVVKDLKKVNPNLVYVCDPVLGDNDVVYLPKELIPIYEEKVLCLADVILPNQNEAEWLTGLKIKCEDDALRIMQVLHEKGPHTVVLTSTSIGRAGMITGYASSIQDGQDKRCCIRMEVPKVDAMFIGTGDLFAALWLAWSSVHSSDIQMVANKVQSTMTKVIQRTYTMAIEGIQDDRKPNCRDLELKLIQSKMDIEKPELCVKIEKIM